MAPIPLRSCKLRDPFGTSVSIGMSGAFFIYAPQRERELIFEELHVWNH